MHQIAPFHVWIFKNFLGRGSPSPLPRPLPRFFSGFALDAQATPSMLGRFEPSARASPSMSPHQRMHIRYHTGTSFSPLRALATTKKFEVQCTYETPIICLLILVKFEVQFFSKVMLTCFVYIHDVYRMYTWTMVYLILNTCIEQFKSHRQIRICSSCRPYLASKVVCSMTGETSCLNSAEHKFNVVIEAKRMSKQYRRGCEWVGY